MAELLKDRVNYESVREVAVAIHSVYKQFDVDKFSNDTVDETWADLELKERGRKITVTLKKYLPDCYGEDIAIFDEVIKKHSFGMVGYFLPDFVEVYGQNESDWDLSIGALERYTALFSSEFAVRPFIINDEKRMMAQMSEWSKHESEDVRRLSSEGCRPQLPWAQALPEFKKDPSPIIPILEQLKADPSLYVRKSVANNLNDISKTHPELAIKLAKKWHGKNKDTDWIIKHGLRTLLKKGNREALAIFGYDGADAIEISRFSLDEKSISIGDDITFSFTVSTKKATKIRLEYGVDYVKANGKRNRKIFQISESEFKENTKKDYKKKHSFEDKSTRKHYSGIHSITLIVNGVESGVLDFELKD